MAMRVDLPLLLPFDPLSDHSSLSQRWKSWIKRFKTYLVAANITDDKQKREMLLYYEAGPATHDIFLELAMPRPKESWMTTLRQRRMSATKYSSFVKLHNCQVSVEQFATKDCY